MNIADRIQHLRKARGISQEVLADKIGVSRQAVSKWESEQSAPDIEKIILLSEYFETTTDYLLKGIEPAGEKEKKCSALLFCAAGTILNAIGLVAAVAIWMERRMTYAVGVGLIIMLVGTGIFLAGQLIAEKDKARAKRLFAALNVWILLLIPFSCCFNVLDGLAGGFSGLLAPVPLLSNSLLTFALFWVVYFAACITVDIVACRKNRNARQSNGEKGFSAGE